jgi:hypothetical protein
MEQAVGPLQEILRRGQDEGAFADFDTPAAPPGGSAPQGRPGMPALLIGLVFKLREDIWSGLLGLACLILLVHALVIVTLAGTC